MMKFGFQFHKSLYKNIYMKALLFQPIPILIILIILLKKKIIIIFQLIFNLPEKVYNVNDVFTRKAALRMNEEK